MLTLFRNNTNPSLKQGAALLALVAMAGMTAAPAQAQSLDIGGVSVSLGKKDGGGIGAGVSVGSTSVGASVGGGSVASVDANVGSSVSANTTVGGNSVASVSANVGDSVSANANVGGSSLVGTDVSVGGGSGGGSGGGGGGTPGTGGGNPGDGSGTPGTGGGTPGNGEDSTGGNTTGGGMQVASLRVLSMARDGTPSICAAAGNFNAINGVSVFSRDNARLGTVVGAWTENDNLVRVRVMVDRNLVQNSGCVEYSTNNGQVRPDGIVLQTNSSMLISALGQ